MWSHSFAIRLVHSWLFCITWSRYSIVLISVHCFMLRSHNILFLPTPFFFSIFPSMISWRNWYLSLRITWFSYASFQQFAAFICHSQDLILCPSCSLVLSNTPIDPYLECLNLVYSAPLVSIPPYHTVIMVRHSILLY